jgi:transcriptional regulator with XRE-family HTH domain
MIDMPSGRTLKAARTMAGLTAKQLANAAGIDASTLSRLEAGGINAVSGRVYQSVINALKRAGVDIIDGNTLRLTERPRR